MSQNKVDWLTQRKLSGKFNFLKVSKKKKYVYAFGG